jgi:hypothetical protein
VYQLLLFVHVLAAFALVATVVIFSAAAIGLAMDPRILGVANALWAIGGIATLVFGVWLAIERPEYQVWDGWVIAAIVLWAAATELGRRAQVGYAAPTGAGAATAAARQAATMHWLRSVVVLALVVVMIYKPGA